MYVNEAQPKGTSNWSSQRGNESKVCRGQAQVAQVKEGHPGVTTGSPRDGIGPEASRLRLSHWAGPSVTGSAKVSQSFYGGIIIVILTKGKPVPLAWEFIYKLGEVTRVTSTILPDMGRKCVTEAGRV